MRSGLIIPIPELGECVSCEARRKTPTTWELDALTYVPSKQDVVAYWKCTHCDAIGSKMEST